MLSSISRPLATGPECVPIRPARRGDCDELVWENLCYHMPRGHRPLYLDLHVPTAQTAGRAAAPPVVVWVHGGGWSGGTRRRFPPNIERARLRERLILAGLALATVDYRLPGDAPFPAAVEDVGASLEWLREHAPDLGVDGDLIGLWGESAGAHIALLAAAADARRTAPLVSALVDWYGPVDPVPLMSRTAIPKGRGLEAASVLERVTRGMAPVLIQHGVDDNLVTVDHSRRLATALAAVAVPVEIEEVPGGHVFEGASSAVPMIDRAIDHLCAHLRVVRGPHPDPEHVAALTQLVADGVEDPFATDDPVTARARSDRALLVNRRTAYPVAAVEDTQVVPETDEPSRTGHAVPLRIQRSVSPPQCVVLYIHGGGWVVGGLDSHENQASRLVATLPATLVQVDYRLAPEHPFPAAYDDCAIALNWTRRHLAALGTSRLVLAGDSAGGNLALAAALHARDRGFPVEAVCLNYPALDLSDTSNAPLEGLPASYLRGLNDAPNDWRVSPGRADLRGLPPVVLGVGGLDGLLEDVLAAEYRLREAGVRTQLRVFPGLGHGYCSQAALSRAADRATDQVIQDLRCILWEETSH